MNNNILGRKNLLITLGDSWTEGVGCYDKADLLSVDRGDLPEQEMYIKSHRKLFGKYGWPTLLSDSIDYDLINLACGGSANATQSKWFVELLKSPIVNFEKYEKVLVIFLLSAPDRVSFYSGNDINDTVSFKKIQNFMPTLQGNLIEKEMLNIFTSTYDAILETKFYLDCVDYICKLKNFSFVHGSAFYHYTEWSDIIYTKNSFHFNDYLSFPTFGKVLDIHEKGKDLLYAYCGHPNQEGYEIISEKIRDCLSKKKIL